MIGQSIAPGCLVGLIVTLYALALPWASSSVARPTLEGDGRPVRAPYPAPGLTVVGGRGTGRRDPVDRPLGAAAGDGHQVVEQVRPRQRRAHGGGLAHPIRSEVA